MLINEFLQLLSSTHLTGKNLDELRSNWRHLWSLTALLSVLHDNITPRHLGKKRVCSVGVTA